MVSAKRLRHHFQRSGGPGQYTRLFDDLPSEAQELVLRQVNLTPGEDAVLAFYFDEARWALLTTRRLCWLRWGKPQEVSLSEIRSVEADVSRTHAENKLELGELNVEMRGGNRHALQLEPGKPFFGFLNALRIAAG